MKSQPQEAEARGSGVRGYTELHDDTVSKTKIGLGKNMIHKREGPNSDPGTHSSKSWSLGHP